MHWQPNRGLLGRVSVAHCVWTFWVMLGRWICGRSRVSSTRLLGCLSSSLFMRQCCQLSVFNNAWSKTLGSNQCLWKQAAYEKKNWLLLCRNPSQCLSLFSHTLSLHLYLSLSLYLPSLPAETEFSNRPRLNFLTALSGCQSRPGSPAHKPPQQLG